MAEIRLHAQMAEISANDWDRLAAPEQATGRPIDPFTTHRFLLALEASGSTGAQSGWQARPLALYEDDHLKAVIPLYVKGHSQGEYIFDHAWAQAYERAGGAYYPKLQAAVPFTPATGRRFLGADVYRRPLLQAAIDIARANQLSSLHITFCTEDEAQDLSGFEDVLPRKTQQFHWQSDGYRGFEDFLAALSSRKRKMIRKERACAQSYGLTIKALTGAEITPAHWEAFWQFYQDTGSRKWGRPYLTRSAFDVFHENLRDDILLIMAFDGEVAVAGALNFIGRNTLYGRYWGAIADYPFLHFELCYYQAIDWALAHGLTRVEAGAQGEHKLARGYLPSTVYSLHWINDPNFRQAIADYLHQEDQAISEEMEILTSYGPFKRIDHEE